MGLAAPNLVLVSDLGVSSIKKDIKAVYTKPPSVLIIVINRDGQQLVTFSITVIVSSYYFDCGKGLRLFFT